MSDRRWQSRIVGHGEEPPEDLLPNPRNWRQHDDAQAKALEKVLAGVGWVTSVIVNRTTGHLVDGHLRVGLAIARKEPSVPVAYVELDEDEEALVLATLDPLAALAVSDDAALSGLLADVKGAGEDFEEMLSWLKDPVEDAKPPPEPSQDEIDMRAEALEREFADKDQGATVELTCPECGEEFGVAGIGITSKRVG